MPREVLMEPVKWTDHTEISASRIVYTDHEMRIPGIRAFGHQTFYGPPLVLQPHYHENAYELVLVVSGAYCFSIDGTLFIPKVGDVFIVQPNVSHYTSSKYMSRGEIYWLQLESLPQSPRLFLSSEASRIMTGKLQKMGNSVMHVEQEWAWRILVSAFNILQSANYEKRYMIASQLMCFINTLIYQFETEWANRQLVSMDIAAASEYIRNHITEDIPLENLAELAGLSLSRFKEKFRQQLYCTPRVYINQLKIEKAKEILLKNGSATQTSQELGFDSPAYFSTVFKKYVSQTPSEYLLTHIEKN